MTTGDWNPGVLKAGFLQVGDDASGDPLFPVFRLCPHADIAIIPHFVNLREETAPHELALSLK